MKKAALYLRVSTEEQAKQDISLPSQKSRILDFCKIKKMEPFDFYIDDGCSGKDLKRPEMQRLIKDAKEHKFDFVVVIKLDRLSRRQQHVMYLIEDIFLPANINFVSVTEEIFDTAGPMGKAMLGMMAVFAQLERETIVERVLDAKRESAVQGRYMGGTIPLGYKHSQVKKALEIDESEAEIIHFIFDTYCGGNNGYAAIAELLNANKVKTKHGAEWRNMTVRNILHNQVYIGNVNHKTNHYDGRHPAIITREQFEKAQNIRVGRSKFSPLQNHGLLKGILFCAECGARMRFKPVHKTDYYYVCYSVDKCNTNMIKDPNCHSKHFKAINLEQKVISKIMDYSISPEKFEKELKKQLKSTDSDKIKQIIEKTQKEQDSINRKIKKWRTAFEQDAIDIKELRECTDDLKSRRTILEKKIEEYTCQLNGIDDSVLAIEAVKRNLNNLPKILAKATDIEKHVLLTNIIKRCSVDRLGNISIEFV
jgi:site-specific DNA recombinase